MFRNKEFRRFACFYCISAAILTLSGFIAGRRTGMLLLASSVLSGMAFFIFTSVRYRRLAQLSRQIDLVLQNTDRFELAGFEEGELSILQGEIAKMTLRIRSQNDALKKEKQYLADSLADIAHQMKTPLTSANLILSFLSENPSKEERSAFIREAEELLAGMDWLITSLLKLSRLDAGVTALKQEKIHAKNLILSAQKSIAIPLELHGILLLVDVPEEITIQGDFAWLSEAFLNLLKNCMENTGENGSIAISCTDNPLFTEFTIKDSGPGFQKEDLPYLFDRFYRRKNTNTAGFGIGLALSRTIIANQGGSITAKNAGGGGALFLIRFPKMTDLSPESHRDVI